MCRSTQTETTTTRSISVNNQDGFEFAATEFNSKQPIYADASKSSGAVSDTTILRLEPLKSKASSEPTAQTNIVSREFYKNEDGETIQQTFTKDGVIHLEIMKESQPRIEPNYGLDGATNFFKQRFGASKEWAQASMPFNISWQTTRVNTGNPRLDQYVYQPLRSALDTVGNIGFNSLKTAGNAVSLVGNSPVLLGGVVTGDYEGSQRFYDGAVNQLMANPVPIAKIFGGALTALNAGRVINKTTGGGRMAMAAERGAVDLRFVDTTGDVPVARMDSSISAITATERVAPANLVYNKVNGSVGAKVPFVGQMKAGGANSEVDNFVGNLYRKETPTHNAAGRFEVEQTGSYNYRVSGGGTAIDIDGYQGTTMLDAKFVEKPANSPYVNGSKVPEFLREKILKEQQYEIQRYKAIIDDPAVPFNRLDILTNEQKAVSYFETLMKQYQVPGTVQVVKTKIPQILMRQK